MQFDFTITAMCRPAILWRTLESFRTNLLGVDWDKTTVYINIDPLPDPNLALQVCNVARKFFGGVFANAPTTACFPAAVRWCWTQPTTPFFFHLEDDWEMLRPYNVDQMEALLYSDDDLSVVNLRAYHFGHFKNRICLSPCLMRTAHAKEMAHRMTDDCNPERQLRPEQWENMPNPGGGKHEGFYSIQVPESPIIRDIGRPWMARHGGGWARKGGDFIAWEKVK